MPDLALQDFSWDRVIGAVEAVKDRLIRAKQALEDSGVHYAVAGGNAVAHWVSRMDEAAVRNTQDVDITVRRDDLDAAKIALERAGFVYRHVKGIDMFLDGPGSKARNAVHIVFAGEKVRESDLVAAPEVTESVQADRFRVLNLDALVRMKLTSYRLKDRVHLLDMLDVGLIDESWMERVPSVLAPRLREVLDNPEGRPD